MNFGIFCRTEVEGLLPFPCNANLGFTNLSMFFLALLKIYWNTEHDCLLYATQNLLNLGGFTLGLTRGHIGQQYGGHLHDRYTCGGCSVPSLRGASSATARSGGQKI